MYPCQVVFCDGSQLPESPGFQRSYGSPGNLRNFILGIIVTFITAFLRDFVAFDAFLRAPVEDNYRYIGFTDTLVNIGGAFLTEDGIFKVSWCERGAFGVWVLFLRQGRHTIVADLQISKVQ